MLPKQLSKIGNKTTCPGAIILRDGKILWGMSKDRQYLVCQLPSKRLLRYFRPSVVQGKNRKGEPKPEIRYWAPAGEGAIHTDCNGFLGEYRTWGGELVENFVQAVARDIMVVGMERVDKTSRFPIVLHNYDELNCEVDEKDDLEAALEVLIEMMTKDLPPWTKGCPVKAEGWVGRRYRK